MRALALSVSGMNTFASGCSSLRRAFVCSIDVSRSRATSVRDVFEIMNSQPSKAVVLEARTSRFRSTAASLRKISARLPVFTESKKTLSKIFGIGLLGSRVFFHKRGDRLKIPKYQNTYRLEPFNSFHVETVDEIVKEVMDSKLSTVTAYHPNQMGKLCLEIGSELQKAIGKKDYDRYKIVAQVTITQRLDQSINTGFQCLWDVDRDDYSYYVFENNHIHACCCVFGLYYE